MRFKAIVTLLALGSLASAAELPPHGVAVDRYGMWTCERGYVMRHGRECIPEAEAAAPRFEVSELPSAGEGSRQPRSSWERAAPRAAVSAPAEPRREPLYIQTDHNRPFAVVLDQQGNPSAVIVGRGRGR